jgi:hypothetical protein
MKGKYITLQIRLACIKKLAANQNMYQEADKTIREQKQIMRQLRKPGLYK